MADNEDDLVDYDEEEVRRMRGDRAVCFGCVLVSRHEHQQVIVRAPGFCHASRYCICSLS